MLETVSGPPILESNSARLVAVIGDSKDDRLEIRWTALEAKELLQLLTAKLERLRGIVIELLISLLI